MKSVSIPIVDGKYKVSFPAKCVYCGVPKEVTVRRTFSGGTSRRRRFVTVEVPYCAAHAREEKRNARILTLGIVSIFMFSCCALFGITTGINRNPSTTFLIFLALLAGGLAYLGRELIRKVMSRSTQTMADMMKGRYLGLKVWPSSTAAVFSFSNDQIANEFAQLNGQSVVASE
ncbi:MAG: hypothetical protein GY832_35000 [Chloroflexi bacterium]|nr:hypothetical protein [Chloroflexota bacterium]